MRFVPDRSLDRLLGDGLAVEVRASFHPGGRCHRCAIPLTDADVVCLDHRDRPGGALHVRPRHADCPPTEGHWPLDTPATLRAMWAQAFDREGTPLPPLVVCNPSTDGVILRPDRHGNLLAPLHSWWRRGFGRPGRASRPEDDTRMRFVHTGSALDVIDTGTVYALSDPDGELRSGILTAGGFLLAFTFRHDVHAIENGIVLPTQVLTEPNASATLWVPASHIQNVHH